MKTKYFSLAAVFVLMSGGWFSFSSPPVPVVPVKAKLEIVPSAFDDFLIPTGNVKVIFSDGHAETWTKDGFATKPYVSSFGAVGWITVDKSHVDLVRRIAKGRDALIIQMESGERKRFESNPEAPLIQNWCFIDNTFSIAIESRGYHGPAYYILYDLKTNKKLAEVTEYKPFEDLPNWAQSIFRITQ